MPKTTIGDGLNPPQGQAVYSDARHLLVLAGAGTGKTRVITHRVGRLIRDGVPAEQILGLTFTNKAAAEMRSRLSALVGGAARDVWLLTFHALGLAILREEYAAAGLSADFCVYDTADQMSLLRELMRRTRVADRRLDVNKVLELILSTKRKRLTEVPINEADDYELAAYALYQDYIDHMASFQAVDFDDLIGRAFDVLAVDEVAARWRDRFAHILVDEYQDTSPEQLAFLQKLKGDGCSVFAVGDDDQSIYAWRGADAANILRFGRTFSDPEEIVLDQNYRSTDEILTVANEIIQQNTHRKEKRLWSGRSESEPVQWVACSDDDDEARFVADTLHAAMHRGIPARELAVLYRSNTQSRIFEDMLSMERIPYRVFGGQSFYERKEVRDLLAYLSVLCNPRDEISLRRIVNVPARGLGPGAVARAAKLAQTQNIPLFAALSRPELATELNKRSQTGLRDFAGLFGEMRQLSAKTKGTDIPSLVDLVVSRLKWREYIVESGEAPSVIQRRLRNLDEFSKSVAHYGRQNPGATVRKFVRDMTLVRDKDDAEKDGFVSLMTIHSAKGLEFGNVVVVGCEEELLPHRRTLDLGGCLDEERRLMYVAVTRAKNKLFLTRAASRLQRGVPRPRTPTRFMSGVEELDAVQKRDRRDDEGSEALADVASAEDFFQRMRETLGIESSS